MKEMKELFKIILKNNYQTAALDTQFKIENRVLIFQDSKSSIDWYLNFLFIPLHGRPAGFELAWLAALPEIKRAVEEAGGIDSTGGYSRGGPFAVYAAEYFGVPFTTFASPCVGRTTAKGVRYAGWRDIVTLGPPGYKHAGRLIKVKEPKNSKEKFGVWLSGHGPEVYLQGVE